MEESNFKPLTEAEKKKNKYLDSINHAPYFTIILTCIGIILLFTLGVSLGAF